MEQKDFINTSKVIDEFGAYILELYKNHLQDEGWINGELYQGATYNIQMKGDIYIIELSLAEYWKYIENGRQAGAKMPPISSIENWINVKKILPKPITLKSGKEVIPSTKSLAFLIARKIGRDGIAAKPYLKVSIKDAQTRYIDKIKTALAKDISTYLLDQS